MKDHEKRSCNTLRTAINDTSYQKWDSGYFKFVCSARVCRVGVWRRKLIYSIYGGTTHGGCGFFSVLQTLNNSLSSRPLEERPNFWPKFRTYGLTNLWGKCVEDFKLRLSQKSQGVWLQCPANLYGLLEGWKNHTSWARKSFAIKINVVNSNLWIKTGSLQTYFKLIPCQLRELGSTKQSNFPLSMDPTLKQYHKDLAKSTGCWKM